MGTDAADVGQQTDPDLADSLSDAETGDDVGPSIMLPRAVMSYDFESSNGTTVEDRTEGVSYDLEASGDVVLRDGTATIGVDGLLQTTTRPAELTESVEATGEFAVAIWLATSEVIQGDRQSTGTEVRIVSYSLDTVNRNFTLAQWSDTAALRIRTRGGDLNGLPQDVVEDAFMDTNLHLYLMQVRDDFLELYRDGVLLHSEAARNRLGRWDDGYPIVIGNEATGDRGWTGRIHSLAIYDRGFDPAEIADALRAGPDGLVPASL